MGTKVYVGNLPFQTDDVALQDLFAQFGTVTSAKVVYDRDTGRSRGFGFVEMSSQDEANTSIEKLNGQQFGGRNLTVSEAKSEPRREGGGGGGPRRNNWR